MKEVIHGGNGGRHDASEAVLCLKIKRGGAYSGERGARNSG
jgi:hypothetical protein